ncbi:aspartate/glutamate racemase family protein [Defluviimonas sp. WL0002]|uniref:Aspartate/glutamate racemase family protein n=1 Tax=Albidovulum marisflavi TaxID=2984159 RepID=A0ABT2Z9H0_9RHOB|nr:aspartate/glutamate racemase family protein [Defluviimonas sp. WL0002]MCV2867682.1 aspartate/glutamate racemase family protein [Defluviimonas sp. WL0002]
MRIHVINPNSTAPMTRMIAEVAQAAASPGTEFDADTGHGTPASIEGYRREAMAVPGMLAAIMAAEARGADAHVIAAVRLAEALAGAGYRTSKLGAYAYPRDKSADLLPGAA